MKTGRFYWDRNHVVIWCLCLSHRSLKEAVNTFSYNVDEPPPNRIQLWSKTQIAVEYDSDSETAAAPTTNRLVGKHVWKGQVLKKPKSESKKHHSSSGYSANSTSKKKPPKSGDQKSTTQNDLNKNRSPATAAAGLKGIVSYYESDESDEPESGIIFPKASRHEAHSRNKKAKLNASQNKNNLVVTGSSVTGGTNDESVSFTMKSQNNNVPKPAVFDEQDEERRPAIPKVKLPPQTKFVAASSAPQVLETTSGLKSFNSANGNVDVAVSAKNEESTEKVSAVKSELEPDKMSLGDGSKDTEESKRRSRSKSKKKKSKRSKSSQSRSRSRSTTHSYSSRSGSSSRSRSRSRSSRSRSYTRSTSRSRSRSSRSRSSSYSSYDSYTSRSRSRSSSYRRSHKRGSKRSSSRRGHRKRSDSYSDDERGSRRHHARGQQGKRKRRRKNKKRRITRAPNPPRKPLPAPASNTNPPKQNTTAPQRATSGLGPKSYGTTYVAGDASLIGQGNRIPSTLPTNEASAQNSQSGGKHITPESNAAAVNGSTPRSTNSAGNDVKEASDSAKETVIIGPQLPKPTGIDEFIAHTSKLGVNIGEEDTPSTPNDDKSSLSNSFKAKIPEYSEEDKEKYSDLMSRLNSHIQNKEKGDSVDNEERSNESSSVQPSGAALEGAITPNGVIQTGTEQQSIPQAVQNHHHQQQQQPVVQPHYPVTSQHHFVQQPQLLYVPPSSLHLLQNPVANHLQTPNVFLPSFGTPTPSLNPFLGAANLNLGASALQPFVNQFPLAGIPTLGHPNLLGAHSGFNPLLSALNPGAAASAGLAASQQNLAALYAAQLLNQNSGNPS
ncbi:uncharacterized protein LOC142339549 isoform X2 [Convolutriloba macropyga]|uniref:uncharacterized protein LOC142339549 isoform X2 n=1 Tax=Convolutriloba macropyga TaxID=536237 RepID=UPI003F51BB3E